MSEKTSIQAKHLLVSVPNELREACFCIPAIKALLANSQISGLSVFCTPEQEALWQTFTPKAKIVKHNESLSSTSIDKALILHDYAATAKIIRKAKITSIIGLPTKAIGKFLTHPIELIIEPEPIAHRVRHYLQLMEELGISTKQKEFFPTLREDIPNSAEKILVVAGSDFGVSHEWPAERFSEVIQELINQGKQVTICNDVQSASAKADSLQKLLEDCNCETLDVSNLSDLLGLLNQFDLCLSSDANIPHLAAFVGTPCLTLFGPNEPAWKRPLGTFHHIIREHVACSPCFSAKCVMDLRCQNEISSDAVLEKLKTL